MSRRQSKVVRLYLTLGELDFLTKLLMVEPKGDRDKKRLDGVWKAIGEAKET